MPTLPIIATTAYHRATPLASLSAAHEICRTPGEQAHRAPRSSRVARLAAAIECNTDTESSRPLVVRRLGIRKPQRTLTINKTLSRLETSLLFLDVLRACSLPHNFPVVPPESRPSPPFFNLRWGPFIVTESPTACFVIPLGHFAAVSRVRSTPCNC